MPDTYTPALTATERAAAKAPPGSYCRWQGGHVHHVAPCLDGHPTGTVTTLMGEIVTRP